MMKVLTVSIAAYNVSGVIERCLFSFSECKRLNEIEIIVVDDGSQDDTAVIVKEYARRYPESIRLVSKENGGHGSTINTSLVQATGKYFKVVDGDDWVSPVALDHLVDFLLQVNADLILNNYNEVYLDKMVKVDVVGKHDLGIVYDFENADLPKRIQMHSATVRTELLKQLRWAISEHRFYVDTEYVFFISMRAKSVVFNKEYVYQYRLGEMGQSVSPGGIFNHIEDLMFIEKRLIHIFYSKDVQDYMSRYRQIYLLGFLRETYKVIISWYLLMKDNSKDMDLWNYHKEIVAAVPLFSDSLHLSLYQKMILLWPKILMVFRWLKRIQLFFKKQ